MRIGIVAALPGELKPLVRDWEASVSNDGTRKWRHCINGSTWIAACSGMGADAARRAFAEAESEGPLDMVLSVGWAGALVPDLQPGEVGAMSIIVDALTGEEFSLTTGTRKFTLVTTPQVADFSVKARIRAIYKSAVMVDMEAATVARMAQLRGIPIGCIKGVSDGVYARLPNLNPFISSAGKLRMFPFLIHLALRPRYWRSVVQLGRNSARAAEGMSKLILKFMKENNVDQLNRTGNV